MPILYLSPSTQEYNPYITSGDEETWMNQLADAMEPMLLASGIQFVRNTPSMTAASSIRASNSGNYDLHLALHSNASGPGEEGSNRGIIAFYYPGSTRGMRAAMLIADNLKAIYPFPNLVKAEPTTTIGEVRRVRAPAVLLELGYHDNQADAQWIVDNLSQSAEKIVLALTEFFEIPFFPTSTPVPAVVTLESSSLNIHSRPSVSSPVLAQAYPGAEVVLLNRENNWALIQFGDAVGYAVVDYLTPQE